MARYSRAIGGWESGTQLFEILLGYQQLKRQDRRQGEQLEIEQQQLEIDREKTKATVAREQATTATINSERAFAERMQPLQEAEQRARAGMAGAQERLIEADILYKRAVTNLTDVETQERAIKLHGAYFAQQYSGLALQAKELGLRADMHRNGAINNRAMAHNKLEDFRMYAPDQSGNYTLAPIPGANSPDAKAFSTARTFAPNMSKLNQYAKDLGAPANVVVDDDIDRLTAELRKLSTEQYNKLGLDDPVKRQAFFYERVLKARGKENAARGQLHALGSGSTALKVGDPQLGAYVTSIWSAAVEQDAYTETVNMAKDTGKQIHGLAQIETRAGLKFSEIQANSRLTSAEKTHEIMKWVHAEATDPNAPEELRAGFSGWLIKENQDEAESPVMKNFSPEDLDRALGYGAYGTPEALQRAQDAGRSAAFGWPETIKMGVGIGTGVMTNAEYIKAQNEEKRKNADFIARGMSGESFLESTMEEFRAQRAADAAIRKAAYERWLQSPVGFPAPEKP